MSRIINPSSILFICTLLGQVFFGCATSTSTLQSARTLDQGEVQITAAASVPLSTVVVKEMVDSAEVAVKRLKDAETADRAATEEEIRQSVETATALALFTPSMYPELLGRVGIVERFDAGLRLSYSLVKVEAKFQYLELKDKVDASVFIGYAYHFGVAPSFAEKIYDIFEYVGLVDYSRHDLDVGLLFGREWGEWLSLYGGPRYVVSFVALDINLKKVELPAELPSPDINTQIHQIGAVGGMMIGYKYIFFNMELTLLWSVFKPEIVGETIDLSSMVISPTIGLTARF